MLRNDNQLLSINDYIQLFRNSVFEANLRNIDIISKAIYLNELFQSYSIPEITRCTYVSAVLVALTNERFRASFRLCKTSQELVDSIMAAIKSVFGATQADKRQEMLEEYSKISNEPIIKQESIKPTNESVRKLTVELNKEIIDYLSSNVYPLTQMDNSGYDVLGRFYTEFIRYAGSEQAQGLVLTPFHITDLFVDLANVTMNSRVYDPCCGTSGFLLSAMKRMLGYAGNSQANIVRIKENNLIGVEIRPSMFTYACSNMMLRGDGRSNIYRNDCFLVAAQIRKDHRPNVAFLNPPYDVGTAGQMRFVEHAVDVVAAEGGTVVAIVQMSAFVKDEKELKGIKASILNKATLLAVISMPDDLFYPVGVVTAVIVLQAGKANGDHKTWFGYLKDDGFIKVKHQGRVDALGKWDSIRKRFLSAYSSRDEISGLSIKANVTHEDEWCAEAYLATDYTVLSNTNFELKIREYLAFLISNNLVGSNSGILGRVCSSKRCIINTEQWQPFRYDQVFEISKGFYNKKPVAGSPGAGVYFVGASDANNGITSWHSKDEIRCTSKTGTEDDSMNGKLFPAATITISNNGSVGCAFYQPVEFTCTHDVNPVRLIDKPLNPYIAMFLCTVIELEKYRWAYGRKWRPVRMPSSIIKLPVKNVAGKTVIDFQYMEDFIKALPYSGNIEIAAVGIQEESDNTSARIAHPQRGRKRSS